MQFCLTVILGGGTIWDHQQCDADTYPPNTLRSRTTAPIPTAHMA